LGGLSALVANRDARWLKSFLGCKLRACDLWALHYNSEDPIGFGGIKVYVYVGDGPTNWDDPFGLRPGDKYPSERCAGWHAIRDIN
jgi:RHS repeat-associated protein